MIAAGFLSFTGLLISVYFALVSRGVVRVDSRYIPSFCRMDGDTCVSILKTREAKIIGIPNFYLGIIFYLAVLGAAMFPALKAWIMDSLRIASGFTVFVGVTLSYSLLFVLRKKCVLCFTAHIVNLLLFLLLLFV